MSKSKIKNKKYFLLIIAIVLFLVALLINRPNVIRLILTLISIVLIVLYFKFKNKKQTIILALLILLATIFIDSLISSLFARIPIYAYNINTSGNVRVYSSVGYRIWQCDKNNYKDLKVDVFYNKGYVCNPDDIEEIDSNVFLNAVIENYEEYKNNYVKIRGKISKKNSQNSIEMQPYEQNSITINGYVTFADNITLKILFNENIKELDLYDIYDEIVVIGVVKNLEHKDDQFTIYLGESRLISETSYEKYDIVINKEATCSNEKTILYSTETDEVYSYCLDEIVIDYGSNKFELAHALSSGKIVLEDLYKDYVSIDKDDKENELYKFKNYSLIKCNKNTSKDIIIGPEDMKFDNITCSTNETEETEEGTS